MMQGRLGFVDAKSLEVVRGWTLGDLGELVSRELEEARARKEYFFRKGDMEEFYYWEGYFHALLTIKGLLRKLGVVE
ncbi:hypothetical protein P8X34_11950 [Pyrococcus kukulkanii]|uniref:Uncharacterized protein n=2 Tax=Pyrococcus kukulkanii TaxID=1609559 RepID=A0ABV4T6T1_9EURY